MDWNFSQAHYDRSAQKDDNSLTAILKMTNAQNDSTVMLKMTIMLKMTNAQNDCNAKMTAMLKITVKLKMIAL